MNTSQIVLVGGPLDGDVVIIPEDTLKHGSPYRCRVTVMPRFMSPEEILASGCRLPSGILEYRPMMIDFMGWPTPSITDDGTTRYLYAGEY